jgi:hypothetical protein
VTGRSWVVTSSVTGAKLPSRKLIVVVDMGLPPVG